MSKSDYKMARLADSFDYIIDSDLNRVEFDDPRVVHCLNQFDNKYYVRIAEKVYQKLGWKTRLGKDIDRKVFNYARKVLTGRECVCFYGEFGCIYYDILKNRKEEEITLRALCASNESRASGTSGR